MAGCIGVARPLGLGGPGDAYIGMRSAAKKCCVNDFQNERGLPFVAKHPG